MKEEHQQDRLSNFFKSHLEHLNEDPGADMWGRIEGAIPPKPKSDRRRWLLLLLLFLFVGGSIGWIVFQGQKNKEVILQLEQELQKKDQQLEQICDELENQSDQISSIEDIISNNAPLIQNIKKPSDTPIKTLSNLIIKKEKTAVVIDTTSLLIKDSLSLGQTPSLAMLPWLQPDTLLNSQTVKNNLSGSEVTLPPSYPMLLFGPLAGVSTTRIADFADSGNVWTMNHKMGGMIGVQLNENWSIRTGFAIHRRQIGLDENRQFLYSENNGPADSLGFVSSLYAFEKGLFDETSVQWTATIGQNENTPGALTPGDPFQLDFSSTYTLQYFELPLWVHYQKGKADWQWGAKAGFTYQGLMKDQAKLQQVSVTSDVARLVELETNTLNISNGFWEAGLGGGIYYRGIKHLQLGLETTVLQAFTPINQDYPTTFELQFHVIYSR
jgi:hypothetical protein